MLRPLRVANPTGFSADLALLCGLASEFVPRRHLALAVRREFGDDVAIQQVRPLRRAATDEAERQAALFDRVQRVVAGWRTWGEEHALHAALALLDAGVDTWEVLPGRSEDLVSIVVPVRGAHDALRCCIERLVAHTHERDWELIVVAPQEEIGAVRLIADRAAGHPACKRVTGRETSVPLGFPDACNVGVDLARGTWVCLLNSDAYVCEGWLPPLLRALGRHGEHDVVAAGPLGVNVSGPQGLTAAPLRAAAGGPLDCGDLEARCRAAARAQWPGIRHVPRLVGYCLLVRRAIWHAAGGMWPDFGLGNWDDDDLCVRMQALGGRLSIARDSLVLHEGSRSFEALAGSHEQALSLYRTTLASNRRLFRRRWSWLYRAMGERLRWLGAWAHVFDE